MRGESHVTASLCNTKSASEEIEVPTQTAPKLRRTKHRRREFASHAVIANNRPINEFPARDLVCYATPPNRLSFPSNPSLCCLKGLSLINNSRTRLDRPGRLTTIKFPLNGSSLFLLLHASYIVFVLLLLRHTCITFDSHRAPLKPVLKKCAPFIASLAPRKPPLANESEKRSSF